jgi:cysteinyl-tRNA synthetase
MSRPRALALAWELLKSGMPGAKQKATLGWLDGVLGLGLDAWRPEVSAVPDAVRELVDARQRARAEKRWADADALRVEIEAAGFSLRDTPAGPVAEPACP